MSIRRIIDLPILSAQTVESGRFLSSFIELSYLSVDSEERSTGRYESKAMTCGDFIDTIPQPTIFSGRKYFPNGISISTDLQLSGDLSVNADSPMYSNYHADLKFGNIDFKAAHNIGLSSNENIVLKGGAGQISVHTYDTRGIVELNHIATVNTTISSEAKSIVNMEQLLLQLAAWKAAILDEIGKPGGEVKQYIPVPIGTIISWAGSAAAEDLPDGYLLCDGREVSKDVYSELYSVLKDKFGTASTGNFKLPLLTDERYLQGSTIAGSQKDEELPQHTHSSQDWMLVYGYNGDIVCDHASSTSGQLNRAGETTRRTTNASSDIYKNNGHVIPKSTTVVYLICYKHVEMGGSSSTYSGIPLLSFMYLDHEITDVSWKKAGSIIDLTEYRKLYNYIVENKTKMRWQKSSNENDTWFYQLNGEKLILPKTNWFVQGETGNVIQFKEAGLPAHTHGVRICGKDGMSAWHGRRGNDTSGEDATMSSYGASDPIYGKSATVQPNATTMFIYFYVGPKD